MSGYFFVLQSGGDFAIFPLNKNIIAEIMIKNVFIFRHGQTNKNLAQKLQGSGCDDALNATGEQQAEALAQKVSPLGLQKLYCSPLLRARQTAAKILAASGNLPLVIMPDLREGHFGAYEGKSFDEVRAEYGRLVDDFFYPDRDNWHLHFKGGESKRDIFYRVIKCLRQIVAAPENNVGIVCHAGVISALQCGLQLENVCYDNCAVLHLQYDTETNTFVKTD